MAKKRSKRAATNLAETPINPLDALVKRLDMVAVEMESKWGSGCLQTLCSPETAAKFMRGSEKLDKAIEQGDYDTVKYAAENLAKGWLKMDQEAIELNRPVAQIWYVASPADNEIEYIICRHELDSARIVANEPHRANMVYTLAQVAIMIDNGSVGLKMRLEPKHVERLKSASEELLGDYVPF